MTKNFFPIAGFLILALGLVGLHVKFESDKAEIISIIETLIKSQQKDLAITQSELEALRAESSELVKDKEEEIAQQNERLEDLSGRLSTLQNKPKTNTSSDAVNSWKNSVFKVDCKFSPDNSAKEYEQSGSGIGFNLNNSAVFITNKHVLTRKDGDAELRECRISQNGREIFTLPISKTVIDTELDLAFNLWSSPQSFLSKAPVNNIVCSSETVIQGESIVILGYPITGVKNSATVTEGIIAGFEPEYYVTSAKIEQGNSGGAAILTSQNCILGLPTFARVGRVESLARILKLEKLFDF